ncbi:jg26351 [Pararge aegeria aegeria]|uniref:Jg26351 protein n=1 Tax=Pararge aegeria aegeria TaxID=348720 RepID=A0A8S4QJ59_9NEOP|nr:jg26351 [Pararge aegeria aegeria]
MLRSKEEWNRGATVLKNIMGRRVKDEWNRQKQNAARLDSPLPEVMRIAVPGRKPLNTERKTWNVGREDVHLEWSPMESFRSVQESFVPEHTGSVESHMNLYDGFR